MCVFDGAQFHWPQGITSFGLSYLGRGQAWHFGPYIHLWNILDVFHSVSYCTVENFWGRKLSQISWFKSHPWKFSPWNLGVPYSPMIGFSIPWNGPSYRSVKVFSSSKVSRYMVLFNPQHPIPLKSLQWNLSKMDTIGSNEVKNTRKVCTLFRRPDCPL